MKMTSKSKNKDLTISAFEVLFSEIHKDNFHFHFNSISSGIKRPAKAKKWEESAVNAVLPEVLLNYVTYHSVGPAHNLVQWLHTV